MEVVDDIQLQTQVSKFQRVSSNTSTTTTDTNNNININNNNNNNNKVVTNIVTNRPEFQSHVGWPTSRIVRVSRASGGKDRHSKVLTSKGLRDRRVRLSVSTAIQFYDLQDRLGCDQPSKAVEWLLKAAASSIDELPSLDPPFVGGGDGGGADGHGDNIVFVTAKSPACSSTSETSKGSGSGLSLSRSENRSKARERARVRVRVSNPVGNITPESSSFTDLLTGGISINTNTTTNTARMPMAMDYLFNNHHQNHQYSFLQDGFTPAAAGGGGGGGGGNGGGSYNLNFAMSSSTSGYRGTLQSNLQQSLNMPHHHHHLQSDGSTSASLPFYIGPNVTVDHYTAAGGYHVNYGGDDHKEKSKN